MMHRNDGNTHSSASVYDHLAKVYDARWQRYVSRSTHATLNRIPSVSPNARVLDVGCGTGTLLAHLVAQHPERTYVGIDPSAGMLARARERLGGGAMLDQAPAEALPYPDNAFDLVISTSSLHTWSDISGGLAEVARVLAPNGWCVLTDWCRDYYTIRLLEWYLRRRERAHPRPLTSGELHRHMTGCGLTVTSLERYRIAPVWGMMTAVGSTASSG